MVDDAPGQPLKVARAASPWFLWLADRSPLHPLTSCALGALLLFGLQLLAWVGISRALGIPLELGEPELRPMMFFAVVLSFGPIGVAWCAQKAREDLRQLEPMNTGASTRLDRFEHLPWQQSFGLTTFLLATALIGMEANVGRVSTAFGPSPTPLDIYILGISLFTMLIVAGPLLLMLRLATGFRQLGLEHIEIDLFELDALAPFGRFGVRTSLVPLGVFGLGLGVGTNIHAGGVIVATIVIGGMSLAALLLPSLGVRQRIVAAKHAEQDRVTRALRGERTALANSKLATEADRLSIPELLAYRRTIGDLREWPIANEGWRRFAAYLLIPLSTWLLKALLGTVIARFV